MMISIGKRIVSSNEQQATVHQNLWNSNRIILSVGSVLFSAILTLLAVMYWCSRPQRRRTEPSELTLLNQKILRPNAGKFKPFNPQSRQNNLLQSHMRIEAPTVCCPCWSGSSSLLFKRRRGANNPLTISLTPSVRLLKSPSSDCPPDEYLQTASRKLTIDELHQLVPDTRALYQEFWATPTNYLEKSRISGAGTKNRYGTIIANEHSRVKLPEVSNDPASSYINANYIHGWPNESQAFIAAQGPMANTIMDFYQMIWQERVPVVVMITRLVENNKSKCERYIPEKRDGQYGPFYVQVKAVFYRKDYEIRRLIVEYENERREIDHYWYTAWPDQSCPDTPQPLIELVQNVENSRNEATKINGKCAPVVVHCSAGIGRTGCFLALSNGIKQLNREHAVDIVRIICNLRRDRGGLIQNHDQYQFLYQALSEYARTMQ